MRIFTPGRGIRLSDQEVLDGLIAKKSEAFDYLYQKFSKMIIGHVKKNSGSDDDAEEVVQITFVKFWTVVKEERYIHQGKMGQYLFQLAANSWKEELRRRRNHPTQALEVHRVDHSDDSADIITEKILKEKELDCLHTCIGNLGEECQRIIRLYHLKSVRLKALAVQLDYNYNNLRKKIFDCRNKLKKMMMQQLNQNHPAYERRSTRL